MNRPPINAIAALLAAGDVESNALLGGITGVAIVFVAVWVARWVSTRYEPQLPELNIWRRSQDDIAEQRVHEVRELIDEVQT